MKLLHHEDLIDYKRPYGLEQWLTYWMPWIQNILKIEDNDKAIVSHWIERGLTNKKLPVLEHDKSLCFAPGPSLEVQTQRINPNDVNSSNVLSADGATAYLLDVEIIPDIVFTDLDGLDADMLSRIIGQDIWLFVLAHDDNTHLVEAYLDQLIKHENLVWCTQGEPLGSWVNTLGFTDGDRCASFAVSSNTFPYLIGFDLKTEIRGKFSRPPYSTSTPITKAKSIKLYIAWKILSWLHYNHTIYTIKAQGSPGIELSPQDFRLIL